MNILFNISLLLNFVFFIFLLKYKKLATHDQLTGLLNRKEFEQILVQRMYFIKNNPEYILLYYMIDLDNFKKINDTLGHTEGDRILKKITKILRKNTRLSLKFLKLCDIKRSHTNKYCLKDILCRWGGEEFAITMIIPKEKIKNHADINIGNRLNKSVLNYCSCSIGVAAFTSNMNIHVENLTKKADMAMYRAKKNGKNQTISFVSIK